MQQLSYENVLIKWNWLSHQDDYGSLIRSNVARFSLTLVAVWNNRNAPSKNMSSKQILHTTQRIRCNGSLFSFVCTILLSMWKNNIHHKLYSNSLNFSIVSIVEEKQKKKKLSWLVHWQQQLLLVIIANVHHACRHIRDFQLLPWPLLQPIIITKWFFFLLSSLPNDFS